MISEIDENTLRIISAVFMFIGTLLVSWRITTILKALSFAVEVHDVNFQVKAAIAEGHDIKNIQMHGSHKSVKDAENNGVKLLVAGFSMQIIGVGCNVMSFLI